MTAHEREIIREIRPKLDAGARGRIMRIYQNLTTKRRQAKKCLCGCGRALLRGQKHYASVLCNLKCRYRQSSALTKREAAILALRQLGWKFPSIGRKFRMSAATAHHYYRRAADKTERITGIPSHVGTKYA